MRQPDFIPAPVTNNPLNDILNIEADNEFGDEYCQVVEDRVVTPNHDADMPHEDDDLEQWVKTLEQTKRRLHMTSIHEEERKIQSKEM